MIRITELKLPLTHSSKDLEEALQEKVGVPVLNYHIVRRSYDARKRNDIQLVYTIDCKLGDEATFLKGNDKNKNIQSTPEVKYHFLLSHQEGEIFVRQKGYRRPVVIGSGPCGFMAGLLLAQMGLRPIILERGKPVRDRTVDTFLFWRKALLNSESNVQFGEGGAGTFSDGKLHTQIRDPHHYGYKVLTEFVKAGAPEEILVISKPHIGTFRLVSMVEHIRKEIESLGGEYQFNSKVESVIFSSKRAVEGLRLSDGREIETHHIILAIGHSARDTIQNLYEDGVVMSAKPFSVGVRIEHPQSLIDQARFGKRAGHPLLGAADYHLVHHVGQERGVYSFCMCPGGTVIAAASEVGGVVTNGMSQYSRAERNANAAIVVGVEPGKDYPDQPLAGIEFQRQLEHQAFILGGGNYYAPVQRIEDFLRNKPSQRLGEVIPSYKPGINLTNLTEILPDFVTHAIQEAIPLFNRRIPGFTLSDAIMTGVETRTSSPIRISRGENGQSLNTSGLFPAGEGAGYAGGIISAAIDGIRMAEAVAKQIILDKDRNL